MDPNATLIDSTVVDAAGTRVGSVSGLLLGAAQSPEPGWLRVVMADGSSRLVPLEASSVDGSGVMHIPWSADTVHTSPDTSDEELDGVTAAGLLRHYGLGDA